MKQEKYERLRAQLEIDQDHLDEELIRLPSITADIAEETAWAVLKKQQAENALEVLEAKADLHVRANAAALAAVYDDDEKKKPKRVITEAQVRAEVLLLPAVQDAIEQLQECELELGLWQALMNGIRTKTSALQKYSDLMLAGYISPNATYMAKRNNRMTQEKKRPE